MLWYKAKTFRHNISKTSRSSFPITVHFGVAMETREIPYYHCAHWNYRDFDEFPDSSLMGPNPITDLYLKGNNIRRLPIGNRTDMRFLKNVYLCENFIEEFPADAWRCFVNLQHLDLSGNLLVKIPEEICRLENLRGLVLDDNRLKWLPVSLQNMKNLKELSVNDNLLCWLPQRIGLNCYSCRVSFWRNRTLRHVPFAVWLHVLKDSQLATAEKLCCLDNGGWCPYTEPMKNLIKICNEHIELCVPHYFNQVEGFSIASPPSLLELAIREFYMRYKSVVLDEKNNNVFKLPQYIEEILMRGPTALCDYPKCKKPLFGYAVLAICLRSVSYENNQILSSAFFCSKGCCDVWLNLYKIAPLSWTPT